MRTTLCPAPWGKSRVKKAPHFTGKARVFDDEDDFITAVEQNQIPLGEKAVVVIRHEGLKGRPASAIMGAKLGKDVTLITNDRFFRRLA